MPYSKHRIYILAILLFSATIFSCNYKNNSRQIARIDYRLSGCFADYKSKLIIYEKEGNTFAKLLTDKNSNMFSQVRLNPQKVEKLNLFIKELKNLKGDIGCTTVEYYTVYINDEKIIKVDGGCDWRGYSKLESLIFN
ncbi:MAG: hypothetical protein EPN92_01370 [Chitinophagaceae bacterium]|nr:MAG: hypothetical protein EPN92_01370 [Chitinophagaceae bacterium]